MPSSSRLAKSIGKLPIWSNRRELSKASETAESDDKDETLSSSAVDIEPALPRCESVANDRRSMKGPEWQEPKHVVNSQVERLNRQQVEMHESSNQANVNVRTASKAIAERSQYQAPIKTSRQAGSKIQRASPRCKIHHPVVEDRCAVHNIASSLLDKTSHSHSHRNHTDRPPVQPTEPQRATQVKVPMSRAPDGRHITAHASQRQQQQYEYVRSSRRMDQNLAADPLHQLVQERRLASANLLVNSSPKLKKEPSRDPPSSGSRTFKFISQLYLLIHLSVILSLLIHHKILLTQERRPTAIKVGSISLDSSVLRHRRTLIGQNSTLSPTDQRDRLTNQPIQPDLSIQKILPPDDDVLVRILGYQNARKLLQYVASYLLASSCLILILLRLFRFFSSNQHWHISGPIGQSRAADTRASARIQLDRTGLDCSPALVSSIVLGLFQLGSIGLDVANNVDWLSNPTRWPIYLSALHFGFVSLLMQYVLGRVTMKHDREKFHSAIERSFEASEVMRRRNSNRVDLLASINHETLNMAYNRLQGRRIDRQSIPSNQNLLTQHRNSNESLTGGSRRAGIHSIALAHLLVTHLLLWLVETNSIDLFHSYPSNRAIYTLNQASNITGNYSNSTPPTAIVTFDSKAPVAENATRARQDLPAKPSGDAIGGSTSANNRLIALDEQIRFPEGSNELRTIVRRKTHSRYLTTEAPPSRAELSDKSDAVEQSNELKNLVDRDEVKLSPRGFTKHPSKHQAEITKEISRPKSENGDSGTFYSDLDLRSVLPARRRRVQDESTSGQDPIRKLADQREKSDDHDSQRPATLLRRKTAFRTILNPKTSTSLDALLSLSPKQSSGTQSSTTTGNEAKRSVGHRFKSKNEPVERYITTTIAPFPSVDTNEPSTESNVELLWPPSKRSNKSNDMNVDQPTSPIPKPSYRPTNQNTQSPSSENPDSEGPDKQESGEEAEAEPDSEPEPDLENLLPPVPNYNETSEQEEPTSDGGSEQSNENEEQLQQLYQLDSQRLTPTSLPFMMPSEPFPSFTRPKNDTDGAQRRFWTADDEQTGSNRTDFIGYLAAIVGQYHMLLAAILFNLWLDHLSLDRFKSKSQSESLAQQHRRHLNASRHEPTSPSSSSLDSNDLDTIVNRSLLPAEHRRRLKSLARPKPSENYSEYNSYGDGLDPNCIASSCSSEHPPLRRANSEERLRWLTQDTDSADSFGEFLARTRRFSTSSDELRHYDGRKLLFTRRRDLTANRGHLVACSLFFGLCVSAGSIAAIMVKIELVSILTQCLVLFASTIACLFGFCLIWRTRKAMRSVKALREFRADQMRHHLITGRRLWQHKSSIYLDPHYLEPARTQTQSGASQRNPKTTRANYSHQFFHYLFLLAAYYSGASIALNLGNQYTVQQLFPPQVMRFIGGLQSGPHQSLMELRSHVEDSQFDTGSQLLPMLSLNHYHLLFHAVLALKGILLIVQVTIQTVLIRCSSEQATDRLRQIYTFLMLSNLSLWALEICYDRQHDGSSIGVDDSTLKNYWESREKIFPFEGITSLSGSIVTLSHLCHGLIFM